MDQLRLLEFEMKFSTHQEAVKLVDPLYEKHLYHKMQGYRNPTSPLYPKDIKCHDDILSFQ